MRQELVAQGPGLLLDQADIVRPHPQQLPLQGGQGVFGIAIGGAMKEITGTIRDFPIERADGVVAPEEAEPSPDELSKRRARRRTG